MRWWNWFRGPNFVRNLVVLMLALGLVYGAYWWLIRRVVVRPGEVLVLLKKDGSRSLPGDQIIIPRPPDPKVDQAGFDKWEQQYADCNGILEQVYPEGTYL